MQIVETNDTSGLENEKSQTDSDEDTATTKKWMKEAMKQLKERTDDVSEVAQSLTKVKMDMANMNDNLNKVADAITKMNEDNNTRDRKFEELMKGFSTGLQERDRKMDKKIEGLEKKIEIKIEEKKKAGMGTRISAMEKSAMVEGSRCREGWDTYRRITRQSCMDSKPKAEKQM